MNSKRGKITFMKTAIRLNVPSYYVKELGLTAATKWRIKETPTAYLLRTEESGTLTGTSAQSHGGRYVNLAIHLPLMAVDRRLLSGVVEWQVVGRTVKAVLPKGRQSSV